MWYLRAVCRYWWRRAMNPEVPLSGSFWTVDAGIGVVRVTGVVRGPGCYRVQAVDGAGSTYDWNAESFRLQADPYTGQISDLDTLNSLNRSST